MYRLRILRATICAAIFFVGIGSAAADVLFSNEVNTANGNCLFQCGHPDTFAADNFLISQAATIQEIRFTGIRTGNPPNLDFTTSVDLQFFNFDTSWVNTNEYGQPLGNLVASFDNLSAIQIGVSFPTDPSQAFIKFAVSLPDLTLSAGQYWLALHANVSGWSGNVGSGDDTSLYWSFGHGDGTWAWNYFYSSWSNGNPALTDGGWAFDVVGTPSPIPEPEMYAMLVAGLGILRIAASRGKLKPIAVD